MNNLIINEIDHSVFDLEWAKRGGCLICADAGSTIIFKFVRNIDPEKIEVTVLNGLDGIPVTNFWESKTSFRMATPKEAGVEYIEPPMAWQSIDTAPKDGSYFIGMEKDGVIFKSKYLHGYGFTYEDGVIGATATANPTRWMPLPPDPKDE